MIERLLTLLFGGGALRETVELFRENAEGRARRDADHAAAALSQFAAEFGGARPGLFDRLMDALNRIPRPAMALGTLGLFIAAMADPVWFAARMQGIALVPEPLWWLMGAIVSFYFGARHQAKGQAFQRSVAATLLNTPQVARNLAALSALSAGAGQEGGSDDPNPALDDWKRTHGQ